MKIQRTSSWYRPYEINGYTVKKIHFYEDNAIIATVEHGWLETKQGDLEAFEVQGEAKKRLKFIPGGVFYISTGKNYSGEKECELYLPFNIWQWEINGENREELGFDNTTYYLYKLYKAENGVTFRVYTGSRPHEENTELKNDLAELVELLTGDAEKIRTYNLPRDKQKILETMQKILKKYNKE